MDTFIQAFVVSFREGLEAFLIIAVLLGFLDKTKNTIFKKNVWHGTYAGVLASVVFGLVLMAVSSVTDTGEASAKIWESGASLLAVLLITTLIVWMINEGHRIKAHIESKAALNLSTKGLFLIAMVMVAREGAEIALFAFAGEYTILPIAVGILVALGVALLVHHSIVKIKLSTIFNFTLVYLIIQAGFLMGYSIHEGLSALKELGQLSDDHFLFTQAFNLSGTVLDHKEGALGIPLYVALGWYSKPEWIQFIVQYAYTILFLFYMAQKRLAKA